MCMNTSNVPISHPFISNVIMKLIVVIFPLICCSLSSQFQKNVLFIAVDDLRPQLGVYGHLMMKTPNIDKLAERSILFERAYCQVALCSPSRASILTGRRPDTNRVWEIATDEYWRDFTNATTIPQYFKENGYISIGMGKVFHPGLPSGNDDDKYSWSPEGQPYYHSILQEKFGPAHFHNKSWESFKQFTDDQLPDGDIAKRAVSVMNQLKENRTKGDNRPFFLAVGFHKPHLPFLAPSKYFDLYSAVNEIDLPSNPNPPQSMPAIAWSTLQELFPFNDIKELIPNQNECIDNIHQSMHGKNCRIPNDKVRELRRAYYAAVSYTDAQVGKVMDTLENSGLSNDTVVILWGDHGWQLGEHNLWSKHTNFEDAVHVPLLIRVPGKTDKGIRTRALVELVDVFPSLAELAGIPVPPVCPENKNNLLACVEGTSIASLIRDPNQTWKKVAYSQYPRPYSGIRIVPDRPPFDNEHGENIMGYTIRTDQYRFTEWYRFNHTTAKANWTDVWGTELYDHSVDGKKSLFNDENNNVANDKPSLVQELRKMLQTGWRTYIPSVHS